MVVKLRVVQFQSKIILVILKSNSRGALIGFQKTMRMILDQITFHSVQLPLHMYMYAYIHVRITDVSQAGGKHATRTWMTL